VLSFLIKIKKTATREMHNDHFVCRLLTMATPLKRQQWLITPSQLVLIALVIAILLSSLSLFHAVTYSECGSYIVHNDVATLLPLFVSSPAVASVSTSLASQQSYGLFNDIPDQRWELMRKRAHEEHTYVQKELSSMPKIRHDNPIIEYLSNLEVRE
jgi:hypothetical protein